MDSFLMTCADFFFTTFLPIVLIFLFIIAIGIIGMLFCSFVHDVVLGKNSGKIRSMDQENEQKATQLYRLFDGLNDNVKLKHDSTNLKFDILYGDLVTRVRKLEEAMWKNG